MPFTDTGILNSRAGVSFSIPEKFKKNYPLRSSVSVLTFVAALDILLFASEIFRVR
jgi:hypothetical protein